MPTSFDHSPNNLVLGTTRTLIYGPVASGNTVVIFAGTFSNVDSTNKVQHKITLERYNGSNYQVHLNEIPIEYGGTSKCPKIVLNVGESLYGKADAAGCISAAVEVLVRS